MGEGWNKGERAGKSTEYCILMCTKLESDAVSYPRVKRNLPFYFNVTCFDLYT